MAESTAPAPGASAMSETLCPGDDGDSSTDEDYLTPDSEEESPWFSGHLECTVVNRTSTEIETDTDNDQYSSLPPFMPCETGRKPDYFSSSEDNRREKNAKNQQFTAIEVTLAQAKLLSLKAVQRKFMNSVPSFKLDKTNKKNILVKPMHHKKMKTVLTEDIRMEEFDVQDGDDDDLGIIGCLNTKERQREIVVDFKDGKLTIIYHKDTESESVIVESVKQLRNPQRIIQLSRRPVVSRFLEVSNNMQRFIQTFHYDGGCQAKLDFQKDCKNVPSLHVTCKRGQTQHVISRVEEHVLSLEKTDVKISLATGLFLQSVHGQCVVHNIEKQHHCLLTVESPAERVQLRATYRDSMLLVCDGNMAFCDSPGVIILPLCEGQREWPPAYKHILEREDISSNARNHARAIGPPPKTWLRIITVSHGVSKRTIIVMHAPALSNEEAFRRQLQVSCKTAIQAAIDICPDAEIVLPLTLVDSVQPKRSALPMLVAVIETISENVESGIRAKLYLDKIPQDAGDIFDEMNEQLLWRGWSVDLFFENIESVKGIVEFSKDESNTDAATVHLFGLKQDAKDAIDEVNSFLTYLSLQCVLVINSS
ncbi:uncharacterized protein [Littorina saxatilis]|uniref:uncharacterized protein isoform X1 n=1 Tax=Littorina saxatilis TaxID=31220 RepID=UPI0038B579FA